ncbi:glutamine synthetase family protein [Desulforegula conservatrix]|uniref:glutamine synthetase family protein n=1 Tax=Desulforegula conservatrix TaxID=153026 RepID=UPI00041C8DF9|nr:glutamine synthetase family protein [Desulforegula conservatrix]
MNYSEMTDHDMELTKIFFCDLNGRTMNLSVNGMGLDNIEKNGIGFDGSSIAGFASVENSDRLLFPLKESFKKIEFKGESIKFFIGKICDEQGKRSDIDARAILEKILEKARNNYGFSFLAGPEHEFFLLKGNEFELTGEPVNKKAHSDMAGYCHSQPHDRGGQIRHRITKILQGCGVNYEKTHHEVTPSQHEINLECCDPLEAGDRTVLFSYIAKKVAMKNGFYATFMPKPFDSLNRSALHIHLSMMDSEGNNLFHRQGAEYNLSDEAKYFMGGILKYARETSVIMASTYNSYKAYIAEKEAPVLRSWGFRNRSSMIRIPYTVSPQNTRIELRSPDPSGNVYLQLAAFIGMGLKGIEEKTDCGNPDSGSAYDKYRNSRKIWDERFLPKSLYEALVEAEKSDFLKDFLGKTIYDNYIRLKTEEWEEHRTHITPREHKKYLDL